MEMVIFETKPHWLITSWNKSMVGGSSAQQLMFESLHLIDLFDITCETDTFSELDLMSYTIKIFVPVEPWMVLDWHLSTIEIRVEIESRQR